MTGRYSDSTGGIWIPCPSASSEALMQPSAIQTTSAFDHKAMSSSACLLSTPHLAQS